MPKRLHRRLADLTNSLIGPLDLSIARPSQQVWWTGALFVRIGNYDYRHFCHAYNCGWPTARMTERAIELAVADRWLRAVGGEVVEIGAVTPYYWPERVSRVVDPFDTHPAVTDRSSLFDIDLVGQSVLSLSTFEHIGFADYGNGASDPSGPGRALDKLLRECSRFLVTVPFGYNPAADAVFFADRDWSTDGVTVRYVARSPLLNDWQEVQSPGEARRVYGPRGVHCRNGWANGLALFERGGML